MMRIWYKNIKLLWWIILALVMLNLSMVLSMSVFKHRSTGTVAVGYATETGEQGQPLNVDFFKNKVGFDDKQMAQYTELHKAYVAEVLAFKKNIEDINNALLVSMKKNWESYDTTLLEDVSRAHYGLKAATANYYVSIRKIATPKQLPVIDKAFKPIFSGLSRSDSWNKKMPGTGNKKPNKPFIHN